MIPTIRARITSRRFYHRFAGRKFGSWVHWYLHIYADDMLINADDCRDLAKLHESATRRVAAFRIVAQTGQRFAPWSQLKAERV